MPRYLRGLALALALGALTLAPQTTHAQSDCPFWSTCGSLQQRVDDLERRARQQDFERMFPSQTYTPPPITIAPPSYSGSYTSSYGGSNLGSGNSYGTRNSDGYCNLACR